MNRNGSLSAPTLFVLLIVVALGGFLLFSLMSDQDGEPEVADTNNETEVNVEEPPPTPKKEDAPEKINVQRNDPRDSAPPIRATPDQDGVPTELAGMVRDVDGNPIPDATISLIRFDFDRASTKRLHERFQKRVLKRAVSGKDGKYTFADLVPGNRHYLEASAPGFLLQIKDNIRVGLIANFTLRPGARVEGIVRDVDTNEPIVNAQVRGWFKTPQGVTSASSMRRWTETVTTKEGGKYSFEGVPAELVTFMLYHPDYEDGKQDQRVTRGETNTFEFNMRRGVAVVGTVLDKMTEKPLAGAKVTVTDSLVPMYTLTTDEKGQFRVGGLKRGTQIFSVQAKSFTAVRDVREISDEDNYSSERNNVLEFRLDPAGRAAGFVFDPDGNPMPNARVFVARETPLMNQVRGKSEVRTPADGSFLVQDLGTTTTFLIAAHADGFGIGVSEPVSVGPGELRDGVTVKLTRGSSIAGSVLDENGAPIAGARVTVKIPPFADVWFPPGMDLGQSTTRILVTGDDGRYELQGIWKGQYDFDISHTRHVNLAKQRVVVREKEESVSRDFTMKIGRYLAGTVLGEDGQPATGTVVTAYRGYGRTGATTARVDADGQWRMDKLVRGTFRVQARKEGYSSEVLDNVKEDTDNLNFRLRENGAVIGSVSSPDGAPLKGFTISLVPWHDGTEANYRQATQFAPPSRSFSDQAGRFLLEDVDPGRYVLGVRARGFTDLTIPEIIVPSGSPYDVGNLRMPKGATVSGVITVDGGRGTPREAVVSLQRTDLSGKRSRGGKGTKPAVVNEGEDNGEKDGGEGGAAFAGTARSAWNARPNAQGRYSVSGLPAGDYILRVQSSNHVPPQPVNLALKEGEEASRDFLLRVASQISIEVVDDFGEVVPAVMAEVRDASTGRRPASVRGVTRTNAQGVVTIPNLAAGSYTIALQRSGYLIKELSITVTAGATAHEKAVIEKIR